MDKDTPFENTDIKKLDYEKVECNKHGTVTQLAIFLEGHVGAH